MESYDELFTRCAILSGIRGLGLKSMPDLCSSPMLHLHKTKAFMYPYLVSNKFRYVMFLLCESVVDALKRDEGSSHAASMAVGIESWDSPKMLEIIRDAWSHWNVHAFTVDLLYFLHAEAITAVSVEDSSVSTLVCGYQLQEVLNVEQALASGDAGECDVSLSWDKVAVLELMLHEFCRVWRRMIQPAGRALTPRGVGSEESPNAGETVDDLIWGSVMSTDLKRQGGNLIVNHAQNTRNLFKVLDVTSWDDPGADFFWHDRPGYHRSPMVHSGRRRISADRMVLF